MNPYYIVGAVVVVVIIGYILLYNKLRRLSVKVEEGSAGIDVALEKRYDMLSEEIEAVKKYLKHEYEIYTTVTSIRTGTELDEKAFEEKKALSEEAIKTIDETIRAQSEKMEQIKKQMQRQHAGKNGRRNNQKNKEAYQAHEVQQRMNVNQKIGVLTAVQEGLGGVSSTIDALSEQYPVLYSSISMDYFQRSIFDAEEHLQAARRLYNANVSLYNQTIVMFPYVIVARLNGMQKADFYEVEDKKRTYQVKFD